MKALIPACLYCKTAIKIKDIFIDQIVKLPIKIQISIEFLVRY